MTRQQLLNEIRKITGTRHLARNFNISYQDRNARQAEAVSIIEKEISLNITKILES
jgi:hypothetical protein